MFFSFFFFFDQGRNVQDAWHRQLGHFRASRQESDHQQL